MKQRAAVNEPLSLPGGRMNHAWSYGMGRAQQQVQQGAKPISHQANDGRPKRTYSRGCVCSTAARGRWLANTRQCACMPQQSSLGVLQLIPTMLRAAAG